MDATKHRLLGFLTLLLWTKGLVGADDVTQTSILWRNQSDNATIQCSHTKGVVYSYMYWYRQLPGELMRLVVYTTTTSSPQFEPDFRDNRFVATKPDAASGTLTVLNLEPEDRGVYFCAVSQELTGGDSEAYFGRGTKLTVLETNQPITPPTVTLLPPSQHECYNQKDKEKKKTLVCVASAFYPDHVSVFWSMNGRNVTTGVATDDRALRNGAHYSLTSRLRVPATTWFTPANRFTCTVSFFNGTDSSHHSDDVAGSPGGEETMTREKYLRITQSAKLSYVVLMVKSLIYGAFVVFLVWKPQVQKKALKREDRKDRI